MKRNLVARSATTIGAPVTAVWDALVDPEAVKRYMFGADVVTDWREGSPIVWKGEWEGKRYEDKGVLLDVEPTRRLQYTHYSPLTGKADAPENYHTVTVDLEDDDSGTRVTLSQDNNPTEEAREHSEKNWKAMLSGLKEFVESRQTG
jgi:uncharacterized protein YndB with AHSA1/START domain